MVASAAGTTKGVHFNILAASRWHPPGRAGIVPLLPGVTFSLWFQALLPEMHMNGAAVPAAPFLFLDGLLQCPLPPVRPRANEKRRPRAPLS